MIPGSVQGQFALVLTPDGKVEEVETPAEHHLRGRVEVKGSLDTAGRATVRAELRLTGELATAIRVGLREGIDSTVRTAMTWQFVAGIYPESEGDSLAFSDGPDGVMVSVRARNGRAAQLAGPVAILELPFKESEVDFTPVIAELESQRPRKFTIDASQVSAGVNGEARIELELPPGWQVKAPKDINLSGPFGTLQRTVRQDGRTLIMEQETRGGTGVLPPSALDDLIKWLRDLSAAARDGRNLVVMRSGG